MEEMIDRLFLKLRVRDLLSDEEEQALRATIDGFEQVPAKRVLIKRGEPLKHSVLLLDGLMCRYKDLRNGRRQISALHVPGDFLDLHGFTLKKLDHDVMALTASQVAFADFGKLTKLTEEFPHVTRLLWFSTNLDAAIHREWELSLGQRTGVARAAHLFCELYHRLSIVGGVEGKTFPFAVNQSELGECLGLTPVHTNRVLRELRERGLATFKGGVVTIDDLRGLEALAEFDGAYLYLDSTPR
jgi:CRP-like cAMP-binding protein